MSAAVAGPDGRLRCPWGLSTPDYSPYHDQEWGKPVHGDTPLFERVSLEAFQSGLSWITILRKRPAFRVAFAGFDPGRVAAFDDDSDVERLMADAGIVRNRAKVVATIANARAVLALDGSLDELLWSFAPPPRRAPRALRDIRAVTDESTAMAKELKRRGLRFVGPTTAHALMQATGMVNDHLADCAFRGAPAGRPVVTGLRTSVSPLPGRTPPRRDGHRSSR